MKDVGDGDVDVDVDVNVDDVEVIEKYEVLTDK